MSDTVAVTVTVSVTPGRRARRRRPCPGQLHLRLARHRLHAGERERDRVVARRQRRQPVLAVGFGDGDARRRQHVGARFDRHAGQHAAARVGDLPADRAGLLGGRRHGGQQRQEQHERTTDRTRSNHPLLQQKCKGDDYMPRRYHAGDMKRVLAPAIFAILVPALAFAQRGASRLDDIRTVPEKTDYRDTSKYADVMAFLEAIDKASDRVHLTTMGTTNEQRAHPAGGDRRAWRDRRRRWRHRQAARLHPGQHPRRRSGGQGKRADAAARPRRGQARRLAAVDGLPDRADLQRRRQRAVRAQQPRPAVRPDGRPGPAPQRPGARPESRSHEARLARGARRREADDRLRPARGARSAHDQRHPPRLSPDVFAAAPSGHRSRQSSTCCASSGSRS